MVDIIFVTFPVSGREEGILNIPPMPQSDVYNRTGEGSKSKAISIRKVWLMFNSVRCFVKYKKRAM